MTNQNTQAVIDRATEAQVAVENYLVNGGTMQDTTPQAMKVFMEFVTACNELWKVAGNVEDFLRDMTHEEVITPRTNTAEFSQPWRNILSISSATLSGGKITLGGEVPIFLGQIPPVKHHSTARGKKHGTKEKR